MTTLRHLLTGLCAAFVLITIVVIFAPIVAALEHAPKRKRPTYTPHPPGYCPGCGRTYVCAADITRAIDQGAIPDECIYQPN